MLRTARSLPPTGLLTLGFDPARFQTEPPACYRASWQLPGPDSHRQATTSLCWISYSISTSNCWAHSREMLYGRVAGDALHGPRSAVRVAGVAREEAGIGTGAVVGHRA